MNIRILCNKKGYISVTKRYLSLSSLSHSPDQSIGEWDPNIRVLDADRRHSIEAKWQSAVLKYGYNEGSNSPKSYILSMFPYPSGALHMGHVRVYTISDSIARFHRMRGFNVLHPMGWDAFGLPAENAAIDRGIEPSEWTQKNIAQMRLQLKQLGFSFDWDREISTCSPDYYRWTQHIFLLMYKAGLVYHKPALVNWDPVDNTVLANEQVDSNGISWRSGAKVEKKVLKQWFIRATQLAKSLYDELNSSELLNWQDIIKIQKEWIGEANGIVFEWKVETKTESFVLPVWAAKGEDILKATFIAVAPGSMLDVVESLPAHEFSVIGVKFKVKILRFIARNPFTNEMLPVLVVDGLLFGDGSETHMGVPSLNETDSTICETLGLPLNPRRQLKHNFDNLCLEAQRRGIGGYPCSARLRDWLISRQRYWGTPIPIVHCKSCGAVPVPEKELPVTLPQFPHGSYSGSSRLTEAVEWLNTSCPKCGGEATRETDTMDTFVDSSWYFLRYTDPKNTEALFDPTKAKHLMPVDVYIGGKEHAVLHLYFARLVSHFLHQQGLLPQPEPFKRLLVQGMVLGRTFLSTDRGRYLKPEEVDVSGAIPLERSTGQPVIVEWEKMSKSKHNGVDPVTVIKSHGADTTRLMILAEVAPESNRQWSLDYFTGILKWQLRLYVMVSQFRALRERAASGKLECNRSEKFLEEDKNCRNVRNLYLRTVNHCYSYTHQLSVAITNMQSLTKQLRGMSDDVKTFSPEYERALAALIIVLAPMAPHFASELWQGFASAEGHQNQNSHEILWDHPVLEQPWPEIDSDYTVPLVITMNNTEVCTESVPLKQLNEMTKSEALLCALQNERVKELLDGRQPTLGDFSLLPSYRGTIQLVVPALELNIGDANPSSSKGKKALSKKKKKSDKKSQ